MPLGRSTTPGNAKTRRAYSSVKRGSLGCWSSWVCGLEEVVRGREPKRDGSGGRDGIRPVYDGRAPVGAEGV